MSDKLFSIEIPKGSTETARTKHGTYAADFKAVSEVAADKAGTIHYSSVEGKKLLGGGMRVIQHHEYAHEPVSAYAATHPAPIPLRWQHGEEIRHIVSLRRAHGRLHAVAECELEPDDLRLLTEQYGDIRFSTSTENRRRDPLGITEISLTPRPATVSLPAVRWWKLDVTKGNMPGWVSEEINRADKTEYRSRGELRVHNVEPVVVDAASEYEQIGIDLGLLPPGGYERRYTDQSIGEKVEIEFSRHPGRIISVGGRPVRRD